MKNFDIFIDKYKELVWVVLMFLLCIMDIIVMTIDFNIWSLIGAVCCGISGIINLITFIQDRKYKGVSK